jgi:hypothetical protein
MNTNEVENDDQHVTTKSQTRQNTRAAARLYALGYIPLVADGKVTGGALADSIVHFEQEGASVRIVIMRDGAPYYLSTDEGLSAFLSRFERFERVRRAKLDALWSEDTKSGADTDG